MLKRLAARGYKSQEFLDQPLEKSTAAAETLRLPRGYASLDELLADDKVDAVHLTSPNRYHYEQAVAVINAGKHVLCEKPLAMNSVESRQLVELAKQSDVVAGVAYNVRFYPLCHETAARVSGNEFGDVLHITGSYVQDWLLKAENVRRHSQFEFWFELRPFASNLDANGPDCADQRIRRSHFSYSRQRRANGSRPTR